MKNTPSSSPAKKAKLLGFSALGAYLAVLCGGILFNLSKGSVIEPDFVVNLHPVTYAVAWLVLAAVLALYGSISAPVVYGFTWIASVAYALLMTVSGESYLLTFAACGLVAVTTYACGKALRAEATAKKPASKSKALSPIAAKVVVGICAVAGGGVTLFLLLSSYLSFTSSPTASTGVYVQLMESLKSLSFDTTLEFGETVSHMAVHISPIFLLYLPFYALIPSPVTVMMLQTLAVFSAVIPLWKISRVKGLSPALSALVCGLLCFFPAVWGGAAGSIHEYALLLPLLLWLLWALETDRRILPWVFAALILCVRETCAIHLFAVGLYRILSVKGDQRKSTRNQSILLMGVSLAWFITAMAVLTYAGKGTLITRFSNVTGIYGTSFPVLLREIFYNPAIALYEMLAESKLHYLLCILLPLGLIPLCTKKKAGFAFLLPLLSLNLLADFPYHFSLDYPYSFGVAAFALYLCADALADLSAAADKALLTKRLVTLALCFTALVGAFRMTGYTLFADYALNSRDEVAAMNDLLDTVEEDASVSASGRLIPSLADREEVYYLTQDQLTEYVVIDLRQEWAVESDAKYDEKYYTDKGYTVVKRCADVGVVLKKAD